MISKILIGIIVAMSFGGYWYYLNTEKVMAEMQVTIQEQANLISAFKTRDEEQQRTIEALQNNLQMQTEALTDLQSAQVAIQAEMNRYLDIFKRHNLSKLAAAKPGLIETRANNATKEVFDGIEADSAALADLND